MPNAGEKVETKISLLRCGMPIRTGLILLRNLGRKQLAEPSPDQRREHGCAGEDPTGCGDECVQLGQPSVLGPVYQLMLAHESGEWEAAAGLSEGLRLDADDVAACYWQAQQWARELSMEM